MHQRWSRRPAAALMLLGVLFLGSCTKGKLESALRGDIGIDAAHIQAYYDAHGLLPETLTDALPNDGSQRTRWPFYRRDGPLEYSLWFSVPRFEQHLNGPIVPRVTDEIDETKDIFARFDVHVGIVTASWELGE